METRLFGALLALVFGVSCTWVPLRPEGEGVRVGLANEVMGCERLGKVTTSVADRIGMFARNDAKIRTELATLARNEADDMGGDTVVAESQALEGRQTFGVYRCR